MNKTQMKALCVAARKKLQNGTTPKPVIEILNDTECFYGSMYFIFKVNSDVLTPTQLEKARKMEVEVALQKCLIPHREEVPVKKEGVYGYDNFRAVKLVDEKGNCTFLQPHFYEAIEKAGLKMYRNEGNNEETQKMPILLYEYGVLMGAAMPVNPAKDSLSKLKKID